MNGGKRNRAGPEYAMGFDDGFLQGKQVRDDLLGALKAILPLAEDYLRQAPGHPDNAKLEDARAAIVKATA